MFGSHGEKVTISVHKAAKLKIIILLHLIWKTCCQDVGCFISLVIPLEEEPEESHPPRHRLAQNLQVPKIMYHQWIVNEQGLICVWIEENGTGPSEIHILNNDLLGSTFRKMDFGKLDPVLFRGLFM